jgi:hypothetical protein
MVGVYEICDAINQSSAEPADGASTLSMVRLT